jgi:ABC-type glycerol-3-phosphate transport system substrate-binding protein
MQGGMMKTTRTVGALVATSLVVAGALTGCSSSSGSDSNTLNVISLIQPGTLTGDIQAKVIKAFEKKTGAKVNLVVNANTLPDAFETSAAGGKEADVAIVNLAEKSTNWVKQGIAVPVSDYLDDWGLKSKILPEALDSWTGSDGEVQAFPYNGFVWPVWYNMDLLKKAGIEAIPTTTEELIDDAGKLKDAGVPGMAIGGNDWSGQKLFLQIAQSYLSEDDAQKIFKDGGWCDSADAMKGIDLFNKLRDAGVFVKDSQGLTSDQMNAAYYGGNAAIMSAGSWAFGDAPAEIQSATQLGGFPIPNGGTYTKPTAFNGFTGSGFWVSQNGAESGKIDLVKEFITSWYAPDIAAEFASASNGPVAVDLPSGGTFDNKLTEQAVKSVPTSVDFAVMPDTFVPGALASPMIRQTSVAFTPGTSVKTICSSLDGIYQG